MSHDEDETIISRLKAIRSADVARRLAVREAVVFLELVKNETPGRDYGPGLDKVIALLNELRAAAELSHGSRPEVM